MNLGIFGGTFDPPHNAHLQIASAAFERCRLDALLFIPAYSAPLRPFPAAASAEDRVAMVRLLAGLHPQWDVSTYEVEQERIVSTIETLEYLHRTVHQPEFSLIIGGDQAGRFTEWSRWQEVLKLAMVLCFDREGSAHTAEEVKAQIEVIPFDMRISSSEIRKILGQGGSIDELVPAAVATYIQMNSLYQ